MSRVGPDADVSPPSAVVERSAFDEFAPPAHGRIADMLGSAATSTGAEHGAVILVSAPSGTGKTAYLEQWSRVLERQASMVMWERGVPGS